MGDTNTKVEINEAAQPEAVDVAERTDDAIEGDDVSDRAAPKGRDPEAQQPAE